MRIILIATIGLVITGAAGAEEQQAAPPNTATAPPSENVPAPVVNAEADRALKEMGAYIGSAEQFTFHADITFDHVLPSGQKLQYSASEDVALKRPGRLYIEWGGDLGNRQFWYDGTSVTLYDVGSPFYAVETAPPEIDGMLEKVIKQLDFSPPLADLFYREPYHVMRENVQYGLDLGLNNVGGTPCRTFAFVQEGVDWQIWISEGPQLTPCKVLITYKAEPSQPQFSAVFKDWDFSPRIAEPVFTPLLPPGTERVPFKTVTATK